MKPDVLSVLVESSRAAIRLRAPKGATLADTETLSRAVANDNRALAPLVWVWCWTYGMDGQGPASAIALSHRGKVMSHRIDPSLLVSYYMPRVEA